METGVKYVRNLVFWPRLVVESWAALNAAILAELEADLPVRHLDDGRSVDDALTLERRHLRAMPAHPAATCRVVARVVDKCGPFSVAISTRGRGRHGEAETARSDSLGDRLCRPSLRGLRVGPVRLGRTIEVDTLPLGWSILTTGLHCE